MNLRNLELRHKVIISVVVACLILLGGSYFYVSGCAKKRAEQLKAKQTAEQEYKRLSELVGSRKKLEQQLQAMVDATYWVRLTGENDKQLEEIKASLPPGAAEPILAEEFFSQLFKDLDFLAGLTDVVLESVTPKEYQPRKTLKKPTPKDASEEAKKAAEDAWKAMSPAQQKRIERDELYLQHLNKLKARAELWAVELEITGTYGAIADFVHALISDERTGWRFSELISVENVELRVEGTGEAEKLNPRMRCKLKCVVFKLKPPEKPKPTPQPGASGAPGAPAAGAAAPAGAGAGAGS